MSKKKYVKTVESMENGKSYYINASLLNDKTESQLEVATAENATAALKAREDGNGDVISESYYKKENLPILAFYSSGVKIAEVDLSESKDSKKTLEVDLSPISAAGSGSASHNDIY